MTNDLGDLALYTIVAAATGLSNLKMIPSAIINIIIIGE